MTSKPLGSYVLLERLAAGGMAEVFVAKRVGPLGFEKVVAVKRMLPELTKDHEFVRLFVDEARLAARLQHPNIVPVFDFGVLEGQLFQAMEYVRGASVWSVMKMLAAQQRRVVPSCALYIAISVLEALQHAHELCDSAGPSGVVHRDVSPPNVLLSVGGEVKLSDFGIARLATRQTVQSGRIWGKVGYLSPEQVAGGHVDARADVFSTGVVLAEMLMGERLFVSDVSRYDTMLQICNGDLSRLEVHADALPPDLIDALHILLARDAHKRAATAAQAVELLEQVMRRHHWVAGQREVAELLEELDLQPPEVSLAEAKPYVDESGSVDVDSQRPAPTVPPSSGSYRLDLDDDAIRDATPLSKPSTYRLLLPDGQEVGPLSFARTVELLATARVTGDTLIATDEGPFMPARDVTRLRRFLAADEFDWSGEETAQASERGDIDAWAIPRLLVQLLRSEATGVLHVRHATRHKKAYLVEGRPQVVRSTDPRELLGEVLVAAGLCSRMELQMAMATLTSYDDSVGAALVELGVLDEQQVQRHTEQQQTARFLELFRWRAGHYAFTHGARDTRVAGQPALPAAPEALIAEGIRSSYHVAELEALLEPYQEPVLTLAPRPPLDLHAFDLPETTLAVLEGIDGQTTLPGMLERHSYGGADPEEVYQAVFIGLCCGLVDSE